MKRHWLLLNRGDATGLVGKFLRDVWRNAGLKGMVVPRHVPGTFELAPSLIRDWLLLDGVDPFAPVMVRSAAPLIVEQMQRHPEAKLGALLRPCEARAVEQLVQRAALARDRLLIIGVSCPGVLPVEAYVGQAQHAGLAGPTRDALNISPKGGPLAGQLQPACQTCLEPFADTADISLEVLGSLDKPVILVHASSDEAARRVRLPEITDAEAPSRRQAEAAAKRHDLIERHGRTLEARSASVRPSEPLRPETLGSFFLACTPCQACLQACPLYTGQFSPVGNGSALEARRAWLDGCVHCGLCEAACPRHMPLTLLFGRAPVTQQAAAV